MKWFVLLKIECFETIAAVVSTICLRRAGGWPHVERGVFVIRKQVRYFGRVQGVGFRATCRHIAAGFAVTGWVQNEAEGSVLLETQGSGEEVERFLIEVVRVMGRNIENEFKVDVHVIAGERGFVIRR